MLKKRFIIFFCILLILILIFLLKYDFVKEFDEPSLREKFGIPTNVYVDTPYAVLLLNEREEIRNFIKQIDNLRDLQKYQKKSRKEITELLKMPFPEQKEIIVENLEIIDKGKN